MSALAGALVAPLLASPAAAASRYAAMVVDAHTGKVLHARNPDSPRFPASLTKIMTLYMLFEFLQEGKIDLDTKLVVTPHAAGQYPTKLWLKTGQTIRVEDAIRSLVTKSANDAAAVVAENLAGTEENFARLMTHRAHTIGMTATTFRNASGLPNREQVTTARDMITLARRIQSDFPEYYRYFRTKYFKYRGRSYRNHNGLLFRYRGTDGIKTGYTRASGFNLTASVRRGKKHLVAVVMGGHSSRARNARMQQLLNRAFPRAVARVRPKGMPMPTRKPSLLVAAAEPASAPEPETPDPAEAERNAAIEAEQIAAAEAAERKAASPEGATQVAEAPKPAAPVLKVAHILAAAPTAAAAPEPELSSPVADSPKPTKSAPVVMQASLAPVAVASVLKIVKTVAEPPAPAQASAAGPQGPFHVQVGAFGSKSEASARLVQVKRAASDLLAGYPETTPTYHKSKRKYYRARFAGFTKTAARGTCSKLQRRAIKCLVMRAE